MALLNVGDIFTEILVRNNRTTTDSFVTDVMLQDWVRQAHVWACGHKKWPFTEGKYSTTAASTTTNQEGYTSLTYPESFKSDSVRLLTVDGKRYEKKNFYKFQQYLEDNSSDTSKLYSDYGREILINPRAEDFSGTIVAWGQYTPILDTTDLTAKTAFSDYDEEGNEAVVEKATSYLKRREHLPDEAELHDQRAAAKLNEIAGRIGEEQYAYQDTANEGMFKRFDILRGGFKEDTFRRDQWGI